MILVFSDLHANKRAIQDIISVTEKADLSIFCGDVVGYGVDISSAIRFVKDYVDLAVAGNHDRLAVNDADLGGQPLAVKESITYTRRVLSGQQIEFLSSLPDELWFEDMYITHSIGDRYLRSKQDLTVLYERMAEQTTYAFYGHTHEQLLCRHDDKVIVNPGSITKGRKGTRRGYVILQNSDIEFVRLNNII